MLDTPAPVIADLVPGSRTLTADSDRSAAALTKLHDDVGNKYFQAEVNTVSRTIERSDTFPAFSWLSSLFLRHLRRNSRRLFAATDSHSRYDRVRGAKAGGHFPIDLGHAGRDYSNSPTKLRKYQRGKQAGLDCPACYCLHGRLTVSRSTINLDRQFDLLDCFPFAVSFIADRSGSDRSRVRDFIIVNNNRHQTCFTWQAIRQTD